MKLTSFILCESARMRPDGTFDVVNGGYAEAVSQSFPAKLTIAAVLVLECDPGEGGPQTIEVQLRDADGKPLQAWRHAFELAAGQRGAHLVLNLKDVRLEREGDYAFEVRANGARATPIKTIRARKG